MKKKAGTITSTPNRNSKRRSSLPNGEGLQLKENSVSTVAAVFGVQIRSPHTFRCWGLWLVMVYAFHPSTWEVEVKAEVEGSL